MSKAHQYLEENIAEYGWTAVGTETHDGVPFLYTIGLTEKYNHPEVVITGIGMQQAKAIVDCAVKKIEDGRQFGVDEISDEVIIGSDGSSVNVKFVSTNMHNRIRYMCQAYYHHDENDFKALQLLWPDTSGVFPDNENFEEKFKSQFLLNTPVSYNSGS